MDNYPVKLQKEISVAVIEKTKSLDDKYKHEMFALQKDIETDRKLAELKIKTLDEMSGKQSIIIEALQRKLEESKMQVQDIAIKAIEGASGSRALAHVNQIAIEQAITECLRR